MDVRCTALAWLVTAVMPAFVGAQSPSTVAPFKSPSDLLKGRQFAELEQRATQAWESRARDVDGKFQFGELTSALYEHFESMARVFPEEVSAEITEWKKRAPGSPLLPLAEAMSLSATGWDARGRGYSSGVESEAWRTFNAFNRDAWRVLEKSREVSSIYPAWFEYSILVASDLGLPNKELRRLFDEGIQRFPGYYGIYFRYARTLAPRWGGNYEVADAFIREQTTANTNPDGEALYARLYWLIDRYAGSSQDFFEKSKVDWRRMRRGFEKLTAETPYSDRNRTAFAAYACRARDATAFAGLRPRVQPWAILEFLPRGYSLQGCDELLGNKAASN